MEGWRDTPSKESACPNDKDLLNVPSISGSRQLLYLTQDFGQNQTA